MSTPRAWGTLRAMRSSRHGDPPTRPTLRRACVLALVLCAASLAGPAASPASRAPSRSEARAIRAGALRALHGTGWVVSHIRISTVSGRYRYAKASVDNTGTGVGGEMILRGAGGRWRSVFLGTDGFCSAGVPRRVLRDLGFGC